MQFRGFRGPLRLQRGAQSVTQKLDVRIVADDLSFVCAVLRAGAGIGLLPSFLARDDVASGALVRVLPRWSAPRATLSLVHPAARHVPLKVIAFRDFVLAHAAATSLGSAVADS